MAKPDEMAVTERQLTQPSEPPTLTIRQVTTGNIQCRQHGHPALSVTFDGRAKFTRPANFAMLCRVMFQGCQCVLNFRVVPE